MDFKKIYREALEAAGSIGNLSLASFKNYGEKYAKPGELSSIKDIRSGKIFTFFYNSKLKRDPGFINRRPLLLIVSQESVSGKGIINGIDLMLLTPMDRLNFIIRFITIYEKSIDLNQKKIEQNIPTAQISLAFNEELLETLFSGINYKHAYTGFKLSNVQNFKEIPMDDWQNTIYLNTKSVEGMNIEDIYNKYK